MPHKSDDELKVQSIIEDPQDEEEEEEEDEFFQYQEDNAAIGEALEILEDGAFNNMLSYRGTYDLLKTSYDNIFEKDLTMDENTLRTQILKSPLCRIQVDVMKREIEFPTFDVEAINRSQFDVESRNKKNITKALIEFFVKSSGFEEVFQESKEEWIWVGDAFRRPTLRPNRNKEGQSLFSYEDISGRNLMIDPQSRNVQSESIVKSAQYYGHTQIYSERALVTKYGKWILDHAQPGFMLDKESNLARTTNREGDGDPNSTGSGSDRQTETNVEFYEVIEYQNKSNLSEFILVGANAFPVLWIADDRDEITPNEELQELIDDGSVVWEREYRYFNSLGEPLLMLFQNYCYLNPEWPYNRGVVERVFDIQIADEIQLNLQFDNSRQLLDYIMWISGGRPEVIQNQIKEFRQERRINRDAFLHIPASLSGAIPQMGVLKPNGIPINEAIQAEQQVLDVAKNSVGINPQRQERVKNASATQVQVLEEEQTEAVEAIMEDNVSNFQRELEGMIFFMQAHDGAGLNNVKINYTKSSRENVGTEEEPKFVILENPNASINIPNAVKAIKDFEFSVTIDSGNLVKRSRFMENEALTQALGAFPIQPGMEGLLRKAWKQVFKNMGIDVLDSDFGDFSQGQASGGTSQQQQQQQQPQQDQSQLATPGPIPQNPTNATTV